MTNDDSTKFERLLIFIVVILCVTILVGYGIMWLITIIYPPEPFPRPIEGELLYLSNISEPNNRSAGVWVEIVLYRPTHVKYGYSCFIILKPIGDKLISIRVDIDNIVNKEGNLTIVHHDLNNDSLISSHDRFHIYGELLTNSTIGFCVRGYEGTLSVDIKE